MGVFLIEVFSVFECWHEWPFDYMYTGSKLAGGRTSRGENAHEKDDIARYRVTYMDSPRTIHPPETSKPSRVFAM